MDALIAKTAEFQSELVRVENAYVEAEARMQHGYMLIAISEMATECPSVATFELDTDRHLEATKGLDVNGNPVSDDEAYGLDMVFRYREERDYTLYIGRTIDVQAVIETWSK